LAFLPVKGIGQAKTFYQNPRQRALPPDPSYAKTVNMDEKVMDSMAKGMGFRVAISAKISKSKIRPPGFSPHHS
jgi:hypothetical protein